MAQSIGLVQTAQRLGPALGPVIGGAVAGAVGLRATFLVTAGFYLIAFILVLVVYVERPSGRAGPPADASRAERVTFTNVLAFENFLLLMAVIFGFQFVDRSLGPVLPLHLSALGVSDARVAFTSGFIFTVLACTAALGHHWCAGLLTRWGGRRTLASASLLAAAGAVLMAMAADTWLFTAAVAAFGLGIGVAMTAAYTTAAGAIPDSVRATGFGFLTSASLIGMAVSPMVAGLIAHAGIRLVFLVDAVMLVAFGVAVQRVMEERPRETTGPAMEDA
jgi:MFS family permease